MRQIRRLCVYGQMDVTPMTHGMSIKAHVSTSRPRVEQDSRRHSVSRHVISLNFDRPSTLIYDAV